LSATDTSAERAPVACGVNVTVMVQVPLAGTLDPQVFVCVKSPMSAPVIVMPVMESAWFAALLVSVTFWGGLLLPTLTVPKFKLVGEKETTVPTPLRDTVCGLPAALSAIETVPVLIPPLVV